MAELVLSKKHLLYFILDFINQDKDSNAAKGDVIILAVKKKNL